MELPRFLSKGGGGNLVSALLRNGLCRIFLSVKENHIISRPTLSVMDSAFRATVDMWMLALEMVNHSLLFYRCFLFILA